MYKIVTKRTLCTAALCVLFLLFLIMEPLISKENGIPFLAEKDKNAFFAHIGLSVSEDCVLCEEVLIPYEFNSVYSEYNELQKQAGFNLLDYAGKTVLKETFCVLDERETVVNVLSYNGKVIGGDISSTAANGYILPLKFGSLAIGE